MRLLIYGAGFGAPRDHLNSTVSGYMYVKSVGSKVRACDKTTVVWEIYAIFPRRHHLV